MCHVVVFSFADIVFVVAVAVVAVIVAVVLVSVRVAGSDLCWVATGTNFILPLLCPFESRLDMGCPIVSVLVVHYSLGTSHSAGRRAGVEETWRSWSVGCAVSASWQEALRAWQELE